MAVRRQSRPPMRRTLQAEDLIFLRAAKDHHFEFSKDRTIALFPRRPYHVVEQEYIELQDSCFNLFNQCFLVMHPEDERTLEERIHEKVSVFVRRQFCHVMESDLDLIRDDVQTLVRSTAEGYMLSEELIGRARTCPRLMNSVKLVYHEYLFFDMSFPHRLLTAALSTRLVF